MPLIDPAVWWEQQKLEARKAAGPSSPTQDPQSTTATANVADSPAQTPRSEEQSTAR
jgi:hypothetical protein